MKFDTLIIAPCANPNAPAAHPPCGSSGDGGDDGGIDNPNCADPVYAAANPHICLSAPRLIVKPEYAIREVGGAVQFKAFLWSNGVESELTEGVVWRSSNLSVALVGAGSGNGIAVSPGIVTISAAWGILNGFAQFEVIAEGACESQATTYVLVLDASKSAAAAFSAQYPTRLAFAKETARRFVDFVDLEKDSVVVMDFGVDTNVITAESQDGDEIRAGIASVTTREELTNLQAGLQGAYEVEVTGRRIIILFSDGEHNTGNDPVAYANSIRGVNALIEVVGLRSFGNNFRRLEAIADGGFFINALPTNQSTVADLLGGLKSYLCSGSCAPAGGAVIGVGQLNFDAFINWDVTDGHVDLIGKNEDGPTLYDLLPGNGLYVDLVGSTAGDDPDLGTLRTKARFAWIVGKTYRVDVRLSGNQREDRTPEVIELAIYDKNDALIVAQDFSVTNFAADFATFSKTFVPTSGQAGGIGGKITVRQKSVPTGSTGVFGALLAEVIITNVTDSVEVFRDNFDADNARWIDPACGGYGDIYGYCYERGCLDAPIPAQTPDPTPLTDLEAPLLTLPPGGRGAQ